MRTIPGRYDRGHAHVTFTLVEGDVSVDCLGMIDTGFTGFLLIPVQYAISLGLTLEGTVTSMLADGRRLVNLSARCAVRINGYETTGTVLLDQGQSPMLLVGMEFLQQFKLGLLMTPSDVMLFETPTPDSDAAPGEPARAERS